MPGDTIKLRLFRKTSHKGTWSTDGFSLKLASQEGGSERIITVLPHRDHPDGAEASKKFSANGSLPVPCVSGEGSRILAGELVGEIRFSSAESGVGEETYITQSPVNLTVVPRGQGVTSGKRGRVAWGLFWLVLAAELALLAKWFIPAL